MIYERVGNIVYGREQGADPSTRIQIDAAFANSNHSESNEASSWRSKMLEDILIENEWRPILREAKNNTVLQESLERVKILYHLSKKNAK